MKTDKFYAQAVVNEYTVKEHGKAEQLHKLDNKAKFPARLTSYIIGVVSFILFVLGFLMAMSVMFPKTPVLFAIGIVLGSIGIIGMSINTLIYRKVEKIGKAKYANDIIALAKEVEEESIGE